MFECNYVSEKVYDHTRYQNRFKNFIRQSRQLLPIHVDVKKRVIDLKFNCSNQI